MPDTLAAFRAAMEKAGLEPPADITPGKFYRFPGVGKAKSNRSGWCKLFADSRGGSFGDYSTGLSENWQAEREQPLSKAEQAAFRREVAAAQKAAEAERRKAQDAAAKKAAETQKKTELAQAVQPYCRRKGIEPHGLHQGPDGRLIVPLRNAAGQIRSLQFIAANGEKRFLPGGQTAGCFHTLGKLPTGDGTLLIAEGFATAASLRQATDYPTVIAFNAGNMKPVGKTLRKKLPKARLIFCADDDYQTAENTGDNPGITAATEAARAVGGLVAVPDFGGGRPEKATDFNDLHQFANLEAVENCIAAATSPTPASDSPADDPGKKTYGKAAATSFDYGAGRFFVNSAGVWYVASDKDGNERPPQWLCADLEIHAKTRDSTSANWGRWLIWKDDDHCLHRWAMPLEMLQGDAVAVRQELARQGLAMSTSRAARDLLSVFLQVWPVERRARCVDRPGWHGKAYVTPTESIGGNGELVVFQSPHALAPAWSVAGSVADWRREVAARAAGNSRVVFALGVAFAGPLLALIGEEGGGFHLVGPSSCGKSTICKAAASVWGDPDNYRRQWRGTSNGFEGMAALHNDGLLVLDEIGQADEKKVGEAAYLFANGQGKQRAGKSGEARAVSFWRLLLLSNGEQSLAAIIAKTGRRINAGQEVRLTHVDAEAGAELGSFEEIHTAAGPGDFAQELEAATRKNHGAVGLEWLHRLVKNHTALPERLTKHMDEFCEATVPAAASGQVARVSRRFALVAVAGELATEYGLTGWAEGEAARAAATCFRNWMDSYGPVGNREEGQLLAQVRAFFEAHGSARFENADASDEMKVIQRVGFYRYLDDGRREFLVFPEAYRRELCEGHDSRWATKVLLTHGLLLPGTDGASSQKPRLPGLGPTRCYIFDSAKIWGDDDV
ncbi:MAG: DUF927 domain-containing protein [Desulfurivibrio sp.]|nr:DUF927 domain-containing protein [Desulfurivibrio sp.]